MKFKYSLLDNLIPLSSLQIDVLISLVRRADERNAYVRGVYYRDVAEDAGCCNQSFYNSLSALKKHGVIKFRKESELDYDVHICGNAYPDQNYADETYVNFNDDIFSKKSWKSLKGHEKYLFLYFYQYTFRKGAGKTMVRNKKDFYEEMAKKLHVTKNVLRRYLHQLKLFYSIGTLNGNLLVTRKKILWQKKENKKSEEQWMLEQYIISQCRRLHIQYTEEAIKGLIHLLKGKRNHFIRNGTIVALGKMLRCIDKSIEGYRPKDRKLSGGLVNKLFSASILVSDHEEEPDYEIIFQTNQLGLCF